MTGAVPPVAREQLVLFPTSLVKAGTNGQPDQRQLAKEAFLYDEPANGYWCPQGKLLSYTGTTSEELQGNQRRGQRQCDASEASACESCPLRAKCLKGTGSQRTLSRDQYDAHREALRERMTSEESQPHLQTRPSEGERPFAVVKQLLSLRQLLLRGLANVKTEWRWAVSSANLLVMVRWGRSRARVSGSLRSLRTSPPGLGARASPALVGP